MKMLRYLVVLLVCSQSFLVSCSQAVKKPFHDQIEEFKAADKVQAPPKHAILFVGSSSIRMWTDLQKYFPAHKVINRGFGGSTLVHAAMYADDIIIPYDPKQVVIYSGENDVAEGNGKITAEDMLNRFTTLFKKIRSALPNTHIVYISMKPSPSREQFRSVFEESNKKIRQFLATQPKTKYVDVYSLMLDETGKPRQELFKKDNLHMNKNGYQIWKKAIEPVLLK